MKDGTTCSDPINAARYIEEFTCAAVDITSKQLKDMRLSFPSGHASFACYSMLYLVVSSGQSNAMGIGKAIIVSSRFTYIVECNGSSWECCATCFSSCCSCSPGIRLSPEFPTTSTIGPMSWQDLASDWPTQSSWCVLQFVYPEKDLYSNIFPSQTSTMW